MGIGILYRIEYMALFPPLFPFCATLIFQVGAILLLPLILGPERDLAWCSRCRSTDADRYHVLSLQPKNPVSLCIIRAKK
jgi:hypothetical protein